MKRYLHQWHEVPSLLSPATGGDARGGPFRSFYLVRLAAVHLKSCKSF